MEIAQLEARLEAVKSQKDDAAANKKNDAATSKDRLEAER